MYCLMCEHLGIIMQYYFLNTRVAIRSAYLQSVIIDGLFVLDIQLPSLYC